MNRHRAREVALQILYRYDSAALKAGGPTVPSNPTALAKELIQHFDHFKVPDELRAFAAELVAGTLNDQARLDQLLETHAANWKISRMPSIDRNLLRMAIYELQKFPDTPSSVVIDEAIELGKNFGTADSPAFINGVLDAIKNVVRPAT